MQQRRSTDFHLQDQTGTNFARPSARRRQLVLAVEDEYHDWVIYGKMLWYNGFDVIHAVDAEEGLRLAQEHVPDIVLADLVLPGMDGIDLCRALKRGASTCDIPVLVLSARARKEFGGRAMEAGCCGYLEKPIGPVEVLHAIEDQVGRPPPQA
ncbi:MAG TPA: response regulator [Longimicrobiales bacterium]|nr:response regulator [Longimicrobiales bacterium]